jgi:hypothetical protein
MTVDTSKKEIVGVLHLHFFGLKKVGMDSFSQVSSISRRPSAEVVMRHTHCLTTNLSGRARFIHNTSGGV